MCKHHREADHPYRTCVPGAIGNGARAHEQSPAGRLGHFAQLGIVSFTGKALEITLCYQGP